jgi:hypothetical protein
MKSFVCATDGEIRRSTRKDAPVLYPFPEDAFLPPLGH